MDEFTYEPEFHYLDEIYLSQIVVDETENISVFAYLLDTKTVRLKNSSQNLNGRFKKLAQTASKK